MRGGWVCIMMVADQLVESLTLPAYELLDAGRHLLISEDDLSVLNR
jgi:hypothetical protein